MFLNYLAHDFCLEVNCAFPPNPYHIDFAKTHAEWELHVLTISLWKAALNKYIANAIANGKIIVKTFRRVQRSLSSNGSQSITHHHVWLSFHSTFSRPEDPLWNWKMIGNIGCGYWGESISTWRTPSTCRSMWKPQIPFCKHRLDLECFPE